MEIIFKRRLMNELLTIYLPSILLLGITYATTFFRPFNFEAALTVNLIVMLVLTTLFIRHGQLVRLLLRFLIIMDFGPGGVFMKAHLIFSLKIILFVIVTFP